MASHVPPFSAGWEQREFLPSLQLRSGTQHQWQSKGGEEGALGKKEVFAENGPNGRYFENKILRSYLESSSIGPRQIFGTSAEPPMEPDLQKCRYCSRFLILGTAESRNEEIASELRRSQSPFRKFRAVLTSRTTSSEVEG